MSPTIYHCDVSTCLLLKTGAIAAAAAAAASAAAAAAGELYFHLPSPPSNDYSISYTLDAREAIATECDGI